MMWESSLDGDIVDDGSRMIPRSADVLSTSRLSDMAVDELSFYDDINQDQEQQQQYKKSPSPSLGHLLSPEGSPYRFEIVPSQKLCLSQQKDLYLDKLRIIDNDATPGPSNKICGNKINHRSSPPASLSKLIVNRNRNAFENYNDCSPAACKAKLATTPAKNFRIFGSVCSESMDDEYMELFDMESLDDGDEQNNQYRQPFCDETNFPSNLNSLISGQIKSISAATPEMKRPSVRRCLLDSNNQKMLLRARTELFEPKTPEFLKISENANAITPLFSKSASVSPSTSASHHNMYSFKRPEPPSIVSSPIQSKRFCSIEEKENNQNCNSSSSPSTYTNVSTAINSLSQPASPMNHHQRKTTFSVRPPLRQCMSMNDSDIMSALARSDNNFGEPDLIGDFSKPFCLPLVDGRHRDLKSISSDTVAKLIRGHYDDCVASYTIIDCRYPYEYEGGHIRGAKNLYTQEQIIEEFMKNKTENATNSNENSINDTANMGPKRNILVFHCEFSSERGPKLSRFLRSNDRESNTNLYPNLDYPEIYLLHNGYKEFFEKHADLCDPSAYRPMLEPAYSEAYKYFRAKSKSWNGGDGKGTANRLKKSRSRLVL